MNVLKAPRTVVAAEYFLLRLPLTAVHRGLLRPRLGSDSPLLLGFERAVGKLDMVAGTVLADPALHRRGTALARKAQATGLAVDLSNKAEQRAQSADAALDEARHEADGRRLAAQADAEATAQAVEAGRVARKVAAEREAAARAEAVEVAARRQAQAQRSARHAQTEATVTGIEGRAAARAAAPAQQLKQATRDARSAATKRDEADRLAELAEAEKAKRAAR